MKLPDEAVPEAPPTPTLHPDSGPWASSGRTSWLLHLTRGQLSSSKPALFIPTPDLSLLKPMCL